MINLFPINGSVINGASTFNPLTGVTVDHIICIGPENRVSFAASEDRSNTITAEDRSNTVAGEDRAMVIIKGSRSSCR